VTAHEMMILRCMLRSPPTKLFWCPNLQFRKEF